MSSFPSMHPMIKTAILNNPISFILGLYIFLRVLAMIKPLILLLLILIAVVEIKRDFILIQLLRNSYRELD